MTLWKLSHAMRYATQTTPAGISTSSGQRVVSLAPPNRKRPYKQWRAQTAQSQKSTLERPPRARGGARWEAHGGPIRALASGRTAVPWPSGPTSPPALHRVATALAPADVAPGLLVSIVSLVCIKCSIVVSSVSIVCIKCTLVYINYTLVCIKYTLVCIKYTLVCIKYTLVCIKYTLVCIKVTVIGINVQKKYINVQVMLM